MDKRLKPPLDTALAWSVDQFADIAGLGRSFVYEELRAGRLKGRKAGRRTLILAEEGQEFLQALPTLDHATLRSPKRASVNERTDD